MDKANRREAEFLGGAVQAIASAGGQFSFQVVYAVAFLTVGWFAVTVEVFLHHLFGERHLSTYRMAIAGAILTGWVSFVAILGMRGLGLALLVLFEVAYLALCLYHTVIIRVRNANGERWYSKSSGISWVEERWLRVVEGLHADPALAWWLRFLNLDKGTLYRALEPMVVGSIAVVLLPLSWPLGLWLMMASTAQSFCTQMAYAAQRDRELDLIDEQILRENLQRSMRGEPTKQTLGVNAGRPPVSIAQLAGIAPMSPFRTGSTAETVRTVMGDEHAADK